MKPQLYMWQGTRTYILERHNFYVEQVEARVLSRFGDIEGEAERFSESEYARLGALPYEGGEDDPSGIANAAERCGQNLYSLLYDLRKQMFLGALAGCFHQWDKELRDFVEAELSHNYKSEDVKKWAWDPNIGNVFDVLKAFGWDCRACEFYKLIDACRLVVNVYKHGKGRSLEELAASYPAYLVSPLGAKSFLDEKFLDHEWLEITEAQFNDIARALRQFWVSFPERLHLAVP